MNSAQFTEEALMMLNTIPVEDVPWALERLQSEAAEGRYDDYPEFVRLMELLLRYRGGKAAST